MRKRYLHTILFAVLLLPFASCDSVIYDVGQDCHNLGGEGEVYLVVNVLTPQFSSGIRAGESINKDASYYEDAVHSLAMVIFKSSNGEKVGTYFNDEVGRGTPATIAFSVKMVPGEYDFYFVANMQGMQAELNAVSNRAAMDTYLNNATRQLSTTLYLGASATEGFPMARVYKKQTVTKGGTVYYPKPFEPMIATADLNKVVAGSGTEKREWVELIRTVAKLEVEIETGFGAIDVDKIYFRNAHRHFRLSDFQSAPSTYFRDTALKKDATTGRYYFYMPEAIMSATAPTWSESGDNKPINYFTIISTVGHVFNIPIITDNATIAYEGNYLSKAKGTAAGYRPDYNIYRNHKYVFKVRHLQDLEVLYQVAPWDVVNTATYLGYGYNVEVSSEGKVTITNTMDDCMPHKVTLRAVNLAHFGTAATDNVRTFGFASETESGYDEAKTKMGYSESFDINNSKVATGQAYLEVYYNKTPGAGVSPDKVFTK